MGFRLTSVPLWRRLPWLVAGAVAVLVGVAVWAALATADRQVTRDLRNGRVFIQDNLWTVGDQQFAVWVGDDDRPLVGRRHADGPWETWDLSRVPGNPLAAPTEDDLHNVYVVAADGAGTVHVAGNMHTDPWRGVRSVGPDLGRWEADPITPAPTRSTYPQFVGLDDGTLLLFRRSRTDGDPATIELHRLDAAGGDWEEVGVVVDGVPTGEAPYLHHVAVDHLGRLHLMIVWRRGTGAEGNGDLTYVRSGDAGRTWTTVDGDPLGATVTHGELDPIFVPGPAARWTNQGGLAVDADGHPHGVTVGGRPGRRRIVHVWHDGAAWHDRAFPGSLLDGRPSLAVLPDGAVCLVGSRDGWLRTVELDGVDAIDGPRLAAVERGWEATYDSQLLRRDGVLAILVPSGDTPHTVEIDSCR